MTTKLEYQVSDHGAGRHSVQVFERREDGAGTLIDDSAIVRDVNGWRVAGLHCDRPQHATPEDAAQHHADALSLERNA